MLICAGGTGGGVYPAIAVLEALKGRVRDESLDVLWVGGAGGMEEDLVTRAGIPFHAVPAAGVHGVGLRQLPGNLLKLARGVWASRRILDGFHPDVLFFTGGYVAVPVALAGWRVPTVLYVPDIEPGMALKFLARFADRIALTTQESRRFFSRRAVVVVTGYPVRTELLRWGREAARREFDLRDDLPVLLVFGGSKGARSINRALLAALREVLGMAQVIHLSGALDWPEVEAARQALPERLAARYHAFPYLHERMGAALASADLVLSRAGASTLGEFPAFGLPAVLVPYPYAWRYQKVNAEYLAHRGAALVLEDETLQETLLPTLRSLLEQEQKLSAMREAMRSLATPQAGDAIADQIVQLAGKG